MWNKIGKWLDYPEDWCDLLGAVCIRLAKCVFVFIWLFMLLLPLMFMVGLVTIVGDDAVWVYSMFCLLSAFVWWCSHFTLKEETKWYPNLLNKLPSCPKIKWKKGE